MAEMGFQNETTVGRTWRVFGRTSEQKGVVTGSIISSTNVRHRPEECLNQDEKSKLGEF